MVSIENVFQQLLDALNNSKQEKYTFSIVDKSEITNPNKLYKLVKTFAGVTKDFGMGEWKDEQEMFDHLNGLYEQFYNPY